MITKRILTMTLFLFTTFAISAQTEKGNKLVGVSFGSIGFANSDSKTSYSNSSTAYKSKENLFSVAVNPNVAWFVADNLAIGGLFQLSFSKSTTKNSNTGSVNTSEYNVAEPSFYIGPYLRYYIGNNKQGKLFSQVNASWGVFAKNSRNSSSTGSSSETESKPKADWNTGLAIGYEYFINKYLGCAVSAGFVYSKQKIEYEYKPSTGTGYSYTTDYSSIRIPVNIGIQVHIPQSKKK